MNSVDGLKIARSIRWKRHREKWNGKQEKKCPSCGVVKSTADYSKGRCVLGTQSSCKECARNSLRKWRSDNPDKDAARQGRGYARVKDKVFAHYGKKCTCCGEAEMLFLTVDHVNNDGGGRDRELRGYAMYKFIIKSGFPDSFQILCWNCNSGRARNGGICPHKAKA